MPRPNPEGGAGESSSVASGGAGSASLAAPDVSALVVYGILYIYHTYMIYTYIVLLYAGRLYGRLDRSEVD